MIRDLLAAFRPRVKSPDHSPQALMAFAFSWGAMSASERRAFLAFLATEDMPQGYVVAKSDAAADREAAANYVRNRKAFLAAQKAMLAADRGDAA